MEHAHLLTEVQSREQDSSPCTAWMPACCHSGAVAPEAWGGHLEKTKGPDGEPPSRTPCAPCPEGQGCFLACPEDQDQSPTFPGGQGGVPSCPEGALSACIAGL